MKSTKIYETDGLNRKIFELKKQVALLKRLNEELLKANKELKDRIKEGD